MAISQTVIEQYTALKAEVPECVLLMQVGVFMQVMENDARTMSQITGLKLRMAGDVDAPVLRDCSRGILRSIIAANSSRHRKPLFS